MINQKCNFCLREMAKEIIEVIDKHKLIGLQQLKKDKENNGDISNYFSEMFSTTFTLCEIMLEPALAVVCQMKDSEDDRVKHSGEQIYSVIEIVCEKFLSRIHDKCKGKEGRE